MWKKCSLYVLVIVIALSATGCNLMAQEESQSKKPVTITFARKYDSTGATQKIIEAFEAKHPHIKVKLKEMPSNTEVSHDQYVTMLRSSGIDVLHLDIIWTAEFAEKGYLQPLDQYIQKSGLNLKQYLDESVEAGTYRGKQWAIPRFMDVGLLYYRTDLVQNPPKTWDELTEQAKRMQGKNGTKYGYVMQADSYEGLVCNFMEFIGAYGGQIMDDRGNVVINSPDSVQGLKKMMEIAGSEYVPKNTTDITEVETDTIYRNGQAVFDRNWPAHYTQMQQEDSKVRGKIAIAPLPRGDRTSASTLGGWMAGINRYSKHKKEAWKFIEFMTGPEGQKITAVTEGLPPTYMPLYEDEEVQKANPVFANREFVHAVKNAIRRPVSPQYPEISEIIQKEVTLALQGKESAEQAVKNMDRKLKKTVGKSGK